MPQIPFASISGVSDPSHMKDRQDRPRSSPRGQELRYIASGIGRCTRAGGCTLMSLVVVDIVFVAGRSLLVCACRKLSCLGVRRRRECRTLDRFRRDPL